MKPCLACPFRDGENEEATMAQNYGCLPTAQEMIDRADQRGEAMSCHNNDRRACSGLARHRDVSGLKVKAYSEWYRNA